MKRTQNKKVVLIILSLTLFPLAIFLLFNLIGFSYDFIAKQKNIPSYNKPHFAPEISSFCEKIENKEAQTFCHALITNNFSLLNSSICENEFFLNNYEKEFCYCSFNSPDNSRCQTNHNFNRYENLCEKELNRAWCLALTKNPYYCDREKEFMDTAEKDECYKDAAIKWEDSSLCDKMTHNKDSCYFYLAIKLRK